MLPLPSAGSNWLLLRIADTGRFKNPFADLGISLPDYA